MWHADDDGLSLCGLNRNEERYGAKPPEQAEKVKCKRCRASKRWDAWAARAKKAEEKSSVRGGPADK